MLRKNDGPRREVSGPLNGNSVCCRSFGRFAGAAGTALDAAVSIMMQTRMALSHFLSSREPHGGGFHFSFTECESCPERAAYLFSPALSPLGSQALLECEGVGFLSATRA
jgi:hypothetical protein